MDSAIICALVRDLDYHRDRVFEIQQTLAQWRMHRDFPLFMMLPTELRMQICDCYLVLHLPPHVFRTKSDRLNKGSEPPDRCLSEIPHHLPLAQVSSVVRKEFLDVACEQYMFPLHVHRRMSTKDTSRSVVRLDRSTSRFFSAAADHVKIRRLEFTPFQEVLPAGTGVRGLVLDVSKSQISSLSRTCQGQQRLPLDVLDQNLEGRSVEALQRLQRILGDISRRDATLRRADVKDILDAMECTCEE